MWVRTLRTVLQPLAHARHRPCVVAVRHQSRVTITAAVGTLELEQEVAALELKLRDAKRRLHSARSRPEATVRSPATLIIGAGGAVGKRLCAALAARGHRVVALNEGRTVLHLIRPGSCAKFVRVTANDRSK